MASWVDQSVIINFEPLPHIKDIMEQCELLNDQENYAFFEWADTLDNQCKYACTAGGMSKEQWDLVARRYLGAF